MLKELRDHLQKKEQEDFDKINKYIEYKLTPQHLDELLEWRKQKNVRRITDFQARRFANYIKSVDNK